ncbi:MAG: glycine zipper 2TM domain-containing protein [Rhodocyclaceae bacterium]|nr:glycine zipper 2TM domain-containing protein [Rhodocyclaceae bacterium]
MHVARHLLSALLSLGLAAPLPALADPPDHAPAHGWRKKHDRDDDRYYHGRSGKKWDRDYGVRRGQCSAEAVGAVVGGVIGGVVGSNVGRGDGRRIATVLGTVLGAVVGAEIARDIDDVDRACLGHALELSEDRHRVAWTNPQSGADYLLDPVRSYRSEGRDCREFDLFTGGKTLRRSACTLGDGRWQMR